MHVLNLCSDSSEISSYDKSCCDFCLSRKYFQFLIGGVVPCQFINVTFNVVLFKSSLKHFGNVSTVSIEFDDSPNEKTVINVKNPLVFADTVRKMVLNQMLMRFEVGHGLGGFPLVTVFTEKSNFDYK